MEYGTEISDAATAFGYGANPAGLPAKSDHLEQPAEIGLGVAISNNYLTYTIDYKQVKWGDAKGYKDFGWEDQSVLAIGGKYSSNNYWLGLGYNKANNPIPENIDTTSVAGGANTNGDTMNAFNYVLFPATVTTAYTLGGGYDLSKTNSIKVAFTHMPEVSDTVSAHTVGLGDVTTKHSQNALTLAYKIGF
jgi:long-chain fatty acid transport protein